MYSAELVAHGVSRHVLLGPLLEASGPLHGLLEHGLVGLLDAADAEVHAGAHLLDLDARHLLAGALGGDEVDAEVDGGLVAVADGLLGRDGDHVLETLDVDLVGALAAEEIEEEALGEGVLVGHGAVERGAGKDNHGAQADGELAALELVDLAVRLLVEVELEHVERLVAEHADHGQGVGALLGAAAKDHERGVVLLGEELERRGVLEGVDRVLLGELLGERDAQLVQVGEGILHDLRARGAAQEEARLGVLDGLGGLLLEGALGAGVAGFSRRWRSVMRKYAIGFCPLTFASTCWSVLCDYWAQMVELMQHSAACRQGNFRIENFLIGRRTISRQRAWIVGTGDQVLAGQFRSSASTEYTKSRRPPMFVWCTS